MNLTDGLYAQLLFWTGDNRNCYITFQDVTLTVRGDIREPIPEPTFCVSTPSELQSALTTAESNGQDDIIRIVQGTYHGNFVYASTEPYGVTIEGGYNLGCVSRVVNPDNTVLDGNGSGRVLYLLASNIGSFVVDSLTIRNGNMMSYSGVE